MANIDSRSLSVCIQALQQAIRHNDFLSQSDTVNSDDYEESSYMFELELSKLVEAYAEEEKAGKVSIPLKQLLSPPFDTLLVNK